MAATAFVGLGSNLADPQSQVRRALIALEQLPRTRLLKHSPLYRTAPMGPAGQPDYINAVAALETALAPLALLDRMQAIEADHQRMRGPERWGPRTLDLDLLLYDDQVIQSERLTVPHPGLRERAFVLYPLADVAPELVLPGGDALADLLAQCPADGVVRLPERDDGESRVIS